MSKVRNSDLRPWQVERRKYQNAVARRKRRQRQKEERTSKASPPSQTATREGPTLSNELISAIFNCLDSDPQRSNLAIIMAAENFSLRDVIKYGLISLGYAMEPELYRRIYLFIIGAHWWCLLFQAMWILRQLYEQVSRP